MLSTKIAYHKDRRSAETARLEHRHFAAIAAIISTLPDAYSGLVAEHFANALRSTNPRFDRDRFLRAVKGGE